MDDDARDGSLPTHPEHEIDEVVIVKDEPYNYYESLDDPIEVSEGDTVTDIVPDTVVLVKTENSPTTGEPENRLIPTDLVIEADFKEEQRAPEPDAEEHVEAGASCDGNNPQAVQPKRYRSGGLEKPNPRYIRIGGYCKRELAQGIDYITCTKGKKGQWTKQCIECSYTTNVTDEMHAHLLNMHNIRRFKCLKCGLTSGKSLKYVKSHFRACYKHKPAAISLHVERIHTHKCPHCSKVLESPSLLSAHHMYSHGDVLKGSCQQCDFKLKPWVSYTQLYNNQIDCMYAKIEADVREPCYICTLCSQAFIYRPAVRSHIKDEHSLKLFKCKWCHHQADWYSVMREHVDKHAGSYPLLRCSQCGFTCRSITDSEKHLRSHGPMLAYICSHCTFTSVRKEGIENHMRYHNIHGRQSVCKHCDAEFPSDGMLKNHVRLYHEVRSSYLHCSRCNFSCRSLMRLITHKRYHRPPKSSQQNKARYRYTCSSCTFETRWKRSIVSHIRAAQHQRLFRCKLCSYSVVKSRYRLRRHLRKHETAGTPLLQCTRCPFKIIEKSIFQRHLNTHKSTALPTDNSLPSTNLGPQYATSQNRSLIFHVRRPTSYLKRKIITRRKGVHAENLTYMGSYETIDNISPGKSRSYTLGLNRRVKLKSGRAAARSAAQRFLRLHCLKCRTFSCMSNVTFQSHMKKKHNTLNPRAGTSDSLSTTPVKLAKPEKSDCEGPRRSSRLLNRTAHKQVVGGSPATNHGSDLKDDHTKSTEEQSISCKMTKSSDSLPIPPVLKKHPDILTSSKSRNVRQQQRKPPKGETPYSCMICKFKTHSAKAMTLHLSQHHGFSKTGDHTCDLCDSMLPDLIHLVNHRRMCRFQALNQSKTSDSTTYQLHEWKTPELVISRTRQHKSELYRSSRFKCEVCCYSSNRACDLVRHCKSLSHKRLVAAAENERVTSSLLQINNPRTILTTDSVNNTDIPSESPPNEFSQTTLLNGQPLPGQPPMSQLPSDQPPIGQPSSSQPPSGQLLSAQPAILPPSPVLFRSTTMLTSQQKEEADSTSAAIRYKPGQNFECEDCSFSTFNVAELHEHMRDEHDRKRFKCDHCYFSCDRRFDLGRHMRTHTGEKPFSCSLCDYTCAHKGQLTTHQRTHTGRCFKCKLCNFSSTCASNLTRHMRGHYNDRRFKCHHCTFSTYTDRARLNIHIRTHNKKMEYQCTQCSFGARTSGSLQRHIAQEHEGGSELLYKCYRCSLYFYNSPSLEDHMIKCSPGAASQKFTEMIRFHDEISSLRDGSNDNNNSHDNLLGKIGPTSVSCDSSSNNVCMMDLSSDTTNNKDNTTQTQVVDYYDTSMFDV